jgi:hypothetical protein
MTDKPLDETLGEVQADGVALPRGSGLNFASPLRVTRGADGSHDISVPVSDGGSAAPTVWAQYALDSNSSLPGQPVSAHAEVSYAPSQVGDFAGSADFEPHPTSCGLKYVGPDGDVWVRLTAVLNLKGNVAEQTQLFFGINVQGFESAGTPYMHFEYLPASATFPRSVTLRRVLRVNNSDLSNLTIDGYASSAYNVTITHALFLAEVLGPAE